MFPLLCGYFLLGFDFSFPFFILLLKIKKYPYVSITYDGPPYVSSNSLCLLNYYDVSERHCNAPRLCFIYYYYYYYLLTVYV